jgi:HEAT repeat protein
VPRFNSQGITSMRLASCLVGVTLALVGSLGSVSQSCGADAKQLAAKLGSGAPAEQRIAADALGDMGAAAQEAVPQLVAALTANDADLRWRAARALGLIGDMNVEEALRKATSDSESLVRAQAIFALGRLKADDKESLTVVVAGLGDKEVQVRRAAVRAMAMIQADRSVTIPLVVKMLQDSDQNVAMRAVSAIAEAGAIAVPALNAALANPEARYWACIALAEMGANAKDAVPGLIKALSDEQPQTRLQAAIALAEIGPAARPAVLELTKLLGDKFEAVQKTAVFALGRIGEKSAAEAIAKADKPDNAFLHPMCVWALARLNPGDKQRQTAAIELMAAKLGDKDRATGQMAARAIAELEPTADVIRPVMQNLIAGADAETADRIFSALASLGARILPLAIDALKDPNALRRERAMKVLSKIGADAAPAVPELIAIAQGSDAKLKVEALFTIGGIGPAAGAAVPAVTSALADRDPQTQQTAAYAAGKIGSAAQAAVPALKKLTASNDDLVKMTSVWALLQIGPRTDDLVKMALPLLSAGLTSQQEMVRVDAAMSLGQLGKAAAPALPALEKSQQDPSGNVRSAAAAAIKSIKG